VAAAARAITQAQKTMTPITPRTLVTTGHRIAGCREPA
jgi:hypothetical protein